MDLNPAAALNQPGLSLNHTPSRPLSFLSFLCLLSWVSLHCHCPSSSSSYPTLLRSTLIPCSGPKSLSSSPTLGPTFALPSCSPPSFPPPLPPRASNRQTHRQKDRQPTTYYIPSIRYYYYYSSASVWSVHFPSLSAPGFSCCSLYRLQPTQLPIDWAVDSASSSSNPSSRPPSPTRASTQKRPAATQTDRKTDRQTHREREKVNVTTETQIGRQKQQPITSLLASLALPPRAPLAHSAFPTVLVIQGFSFLTPQHTQQTPPNTTPFCRLTLTLTCPASGAFLPDYFSALPGFEVHFPLRESLRWRQFPAQVPADF